MLIATKLASSASDDTSSAKARSRNGEAVRRSASINAADASASQTIGQLSGVSASSRVASIHHDAAFFASIPNRGFHGGVLDRLDGLVPVAVLTFAAQVVGLT